MKKSSENVEKKSVGTVAAKVALSAVIVFLLFIFIALLFYTYYNDGSQALVDLMKNA